MRCLQTVVTAVACFALLAGVGIARAPVPRDTPTPAGKEQTLPITKEVGITFCWIPSGECQLGSMKDEPDMVEASHAQALIAAGVKPQHAVKTATEKPGAWTHESEAVRGKFATRGFWLGKFQVTQEQWIAVMGDDDLRFTFRKGGKEAKAVNGVDTRAFPVESVTWDECVRFAGKLQDRLGREAGVVRLPHENEWEYACRGGMGNGTPFFFGSACNGKEGNCNGKIPFNTDKKGPNLARPTSVGQYAKVVPHPWGLCDMGFNVREWCENPYAKESEYMAVRGGSWDAPAWASRSAARSGRKSFDRSSDIGLRVVLEARPAPPK